MSATTESGPAFLATAKILDLVVMGQSANPGTPLLIRGEPGVGKDTLARLIHTTSARRPYAFIKVNCAVQPVDRLETDLFGHEKGVSPAVTRRRLGCFEFANHGTLYLDGIEAVPRALLPRLVEVLRTGRLSRTGARETLPINVRVIASAVHGAETGGRDDVWEELHRLNAAEVRIPPLRQRAEEIPVFASFFLERFNRRYGREARLGSDVMATFGTHSWPGNVRELERVVHRLVVGRGDVCR